jgi:ribosomal protein S18 acetylase RimI-like enzyme
MNLRTCTSRDRDAIITLWNACALTRPWNDPGLDFDRKLALDDDLFLVGVLEANPESLIATVMVGYDGHRGWVNYLAVSPDHQGCGHGRTLMQAAEAHLVARGCPKLNLQVRTGNEAVLAFYAALGYTVDDVVSLGKRLIADT